MLLWTFSSPGWLPLLLTAPMPHATPQPLVSILGHHLSWKNRMQLASDRIPPRGCRHAGRGSARRVPDAEGLDRVAPCLGAQVKKQPLHRDGAQGLATSTLVSTVVRY